MFDSKSCSLGATLRCLLQSLILLALFAGTSTTVFAQENVHGLGGGKSCTRIPRTCDIDADCPGGDECTEAFCNLEIPDTLRCVIEVQYNDDFGDTITLNEVFDTVFANPSNVRQPAVGNARISFVSGDTNCTVDGALPCQMGPLDGSNTVVQFVVDSYAPDADDPNPLLDQSTIEYTDDCSGTDPEVPTGNCVVNRPPLLFNAGSSLQTGCGIRNVENSTPCTDNSLECWDAGCFDGVCVQDHVPVAPSTPCTEAAGTECTIAGCDGAGTCDPLHTAVADSTPCGDTDFECWDAGCESGVCVQQHTPVAPSTPCTEADGTECSTAGCDGAGTCDPLHNPVADSTPCTDDSFECWDAGCESGVCVQQHTPVAPSTPCTEADGTECTTAGCDGAGTCDPLHNPVADSTPCTDDSFECWDAGCESGVCVQQHTAVAPSTPCTEAAGTECTTAGCDGAGTCDPLHNPVADSTPCTDDSEECWDAGCESGVCVQQHTPVAPSTPCTDDSEECFDAGCDGAGTCDQLHVENDECLGVELCRTPGYWGTHGDNALEVALSTDEGYIWVCGHPISNINVGDSDSILEGICTSPKGTQERQLFRQLTAAALNCVMSGANDQDCTGVSIGDHFAACNDLCEDPEIGNGYTVNMCIDALDCFNNGGFWDGTQCVENIGECHLVSDDSPTGNFCDSTVPCASGEYCIPFPSCHDLELCQEEPGTLCFPGGPAATPKECNQARKNGLFLPF